MPDQRIAVRLRLSQKKRLEEEAAQRGVEVSGLVRAIVDLHLQSVDGAVLGLVTESVSILRIRHREGVLEAVIPRRRLRPRAN